MKVKFISEKAIHFFMSNNGRFLGRINFNSDYNLLFEIFFYCFCSSKQKAFVKKFSKVKKMHKIKVENTVFVIQNTCRCFFRLIFAQLCDFPMNLPSRIFMHFTRICKFTVLEIRNLNIVLEQKYVLGVFGNGYFYVLLKYTLNILK